MKLKGLDEKEVYAGTSSKNTGLVRAMHDGAVRISAYKKVLAVFSMVSKGDLSANTIYELPSLPEIS